MFQTIIVEDEQILRTGIVSLIPWEELGCQVSASFSTGIEALKFIQNNPVHLVISDIRMPHMSGIELAKALQAEHPEIGVILLSAFSDFHYAQDALRFGVLRYVLKQDFMHDLPAAVLEATKILSERLSDQQKLLLTSEELLFGEIPLTHKNIPQPLWSCLGGSYCFSVLELVPGTKIPFSQSVSSFWDAAIQMNLFPFSSCAYWERISESVAWCVSQNARNFPPNGFLSDSSQYLPFRICVETSPQHTGPADFRSAVKATTKNLSSLYQPEYAATSVPAQPFTAHYINSLAETLVLAIKEQNENKLQQSIHYLFTLFQQNSMVLSQIWLPVRDTISAAILLMQEQGFTLSEKLPSLRTQFDSWSRYIYSPFALENYVIRFLIEISHSCLQPCKQKNDLVLLANQYITQHYQSNVRLDDIAAALHVNSSYLSRLYKKETGIPLTTFLNQYRIKKAKLLLQTHNHTIAEVGYLVGYTDPAYFTSVFSKYTGQSPKSYSQHPQLNIEDTESIQQ